MKLSNEHKKIGGFALIILLLVILIYMNRDKPAVQALTDKFKKPVTPPATLTPPVTTPFNVVDAKPVANDSWPLKEGSRGDRVKTLQQAINRLNDNTGKKYPILSVDGELGAKTKKAVIVQAGTVYWTSEGMTQNNFNLLCQNAIASGGTTPNNSLTAGLTTSPTYSWTK